MAARRGQDMGERTDMTLQTPTFDLDGFTPYLAAVVAQTLSDGLAREYQARFAISVPDWRVLVHLTHSDGASVRDIEKRVVMEKSKVSRAVARLEGRGLIAKRQSEDDKRLLHLSLTDAGRALMLELLPMATAYQERIRRCLGPDYAVFQRCLGLLRSEFPGDADAGR
ncbi:MarR family winged helix-turn-helix transcriptional regulator [Pseudooceanicola sp.]|uniref:MarR family winged helix-turn-helix transcriptional regulator n=1 Tax=Pseudooceanicola sp. TaxID=1914328 RepID=UPI0035C76FF7